MTKSFALLLTLIAGAIVLTVFLIAHAVRCDVVDRVGNRHNCTAWTGWAEF